jgi:hypothetical protein
MTEEELQKKWKRLRFRVGFFRFVPYVDFVFVAGSMAMGNPRMDSDFDVIIGVRKGRIFSARFFSVLLFELLGWRKGREEYSEKDKVCMSHFVTESRYALAPPHDAYWDALYSAVVPVWGDMRAIERFIEANNAWLSHPRSTDAYANKWFIPKPKARITKIFEYVCGHTFGNLAESWHRRMQMDRVIRSQQEDAGYKPRIVVSDEELEFHPDTRRIDQFLEQNEQ